MDTEIEQEVVEQTEEQLSEQVVEPAELKSEEAKIAAEVLETLEPEVEEEVKVPGAVVAELRAERRANRQLIETLQQQLTERSKPVEAPPELSPLQIWVGQRREAGYDPDEEPVPASVQLAQEEWKEQKTQKRSQIEQAQTREQLGNESVKRAKSTYSDFEEVVEMGSRHLTQGNKIDIFNSTDPAAMLYKLSIKAVLDSGTADAKLMRHNLQSKLKTGTSTVSPNKKVETKRSNEAGTEEAVTIETGSMNKQLAHIYAAFGM